MSGSKSRFPRHGRNVKRNGRKRAKRYLVVCGGEVTETQYFEHIRNILDDVVISVRSKARTPAQLAEFAVSCKTDDARDDSTDHYAEVFVVVDVDDFHDHNRAQRICKEHGIRLVISNPCFEVWLVDHVRSCPESYTVTADVERYAAQLGVTKGSRDKYIDFSKIDGHMDDAITNAGKHNTSERQKARNLLAFGKENDYAPWTDMPDVVQTIKQ